MGISEPVESVLVECLIRQEAGGVRLTLHVLSADVHDGGTVGRRGPLAGHAPRAAAAVARGRLAVAVAPSAVVAHGVLPLAVDAEEKELGDGLARDEGVLVRNLQSIMRKMIVCFTDYRAFKK